MLEIVDTIRQVAPSDITVLVTGESGTGKEVVARALHAASKRSGKPIVTVNCGAIPEGLIESELFGHEKGAFTSANEQRKGYFETADGGTIFLDEIGELPLATQVRLLRVLENGEYVRVGSSQSRTADVRVIAATNRSLELEVQQKRFRSDLYFRLRSVNIHLPPLRDRREDLPLLVEQFAREISAQQGVKFEGFTDDATALMMNYDWPGNIRELRNALESMLVLEGGRRLGAETVEKYLKGRASVNVERNLPVVTGKSVEQAERELIYRALLDIRSNLMELRDLVSNGDRAFSRRPTSERAADTSALSLDEMERKMIQTALERHEGNRRLAARDLNISERTLYRKIKEYGLAE
ncbi:MAG: sigma-54 dependent transcriptional regulator [Bacteroidetes bacterium]|jgi:DNA-binding NtrC family response regulator|nr:sigma-54 dependent transcriptional regulator [Bacteroidota bacterium]